jgi:hypothetical protein
METFADIVDEVRKLTTSQLEELQLIIQKRKTERSRKSILQNLKKAKAEESAGKLVFSSDTKFLRKQLGL